MLEGCVRIILSLKKFTNLKLFWTLNCDFHEMFFSNLVQVNNNKVHSRCKGLSPSFDFLPQLHLWFRLLHYHNSRAGLWVEQYIFLNMEAPPAMVELRSNLLLSQLLIFSDMSSLLACFWCTELFVYGTLCTVYILQYRVCSAWCFFYFQDLQIQIKNWAVHKYIFIGVTPKKIK